MMVRVRSAVLLSWVVLILLLGGASAAGFTANTVLQLVGAALIGWTVAGPGCPNPSGLKAFWVALAVLAAIQFLPLPPSLWGLLPGREAVMEGFSLLGFPPSWATMSLAPWQSVGSLTWWIPALATVLLLRGEEAPAFRRSAIAIITVGLLSIVLGGMQVLGGLAYVYEITNFGFGVGFFANSNHQGNFLLVCLILLGAVLADTIANAKRPDSKLASRVLSGAVGLTLVVGILLSGSLACYLFLPPVLVAVFLIQRPALTFSRLQVSLAVAAAVAAVVVVVFYGSNNDLVREGAIEGLSRQDFLFHGLTMIRDFAPFGSGLGTFVQLYPSYESADIVGTTFVNHAHNDLLELLIETGVFGLVAVALFLLWYARRALSVWKTERSSPFLLAGTVIVALQLAHSLGDYPLRTAALSSMMALGCVLMIAPGVAARREREKTARRSRDEPLTISVAVGPSAFPREDRRK